MEEMVGQRSASVLVKNALQSPKSDVESSGWCVQTKAGIRTSRSLMGNVLPLFWFLFVSETQVSKGERDRFPRTHSPVEAGWCQAVIVVWVCVCQGGSLFASFTSFIKMSQIGFK